MRALEPWVELPLQAFLDESAARLTLLMTSSGQVVAQHGFARSLDVMTAAALGAGIVASTEEMARLMGGTRFEALVHHGARQSCLLSVFATPRGRWIGLVVPREAVATPTLAENFEHELNASLKALFGR
jgi:hypothetical protein